MIHEYFIPKTFSANRKAGSHWRGRIGPLHDNMLKCEFFHITLEILDRCAGSHSIAELPPLPGDTPFLSPLGNPFKHVLGRFLMVWSWIKCSEMWGNPILLQHGTNWEGLLIASEGEVVWERAGVFQGENIPAGFVGLPVCRGGVTACRCPGTVEWGLRRLQPVPPPANSSRVESPGLVAMQWMAGSGKRSSHQCNSDTC